jgi:hypothetical protein
MAQTLQTFWHVSAVTSGILVPLLASVVALVVLQGVKATVGGVGQIVALWLEARARRKAPTAEHEG